MKSKNIIRAVSLILTAVMVAPLASCGEQTTDDSVATSDATDTETSAETEGDVSPLYEMDKKRL